MSAENAIVFSNVSKFYGEVLGVNKINLTIPPGVTSLVGPNGSGKTTLMNVLTGLLQPSKGWVRVHGLSPAEPEEFYPLIGYCTQFDTFPKGLTGYALVHSLVTLHGKGRTDTESITWEAIEKVGLTDAAHRRIAGYSKGMRQRIKLAIAIAHRPSVLVLDEPLNGLDPMARTEFIELFQQLAADGLHVVVSSHILHEVDMISDQVVMMSHGYVVAEGEIQGVRSEIDEHPITILVRCDRPTIIASRVFADPNVVEARISDDGRGVIVKTRNVDEFYSLLNAIVLEEALNVEGVATTDEDIHSVYNYLVGPNGQPT